jgi:hypothetical protein
MLIGYNYRKSSLLDQKKVKKTLILQSFFDFFLIKNYLLRIKKILMINKLKFKLKLKNEILALILFKIYI